MRETRRYASVLIAIDPSLPDAFDAACNRLHLDHVSHTAAA
jgi:hypothetical protein